MIGLLKMIVRFPVFVMSYICAVSGSTTFSVGTYPYFFFR